MSRLGAVGAGFACLVLGLYPYINRGGNQYGPRFYFDGFPLLVILAAAAIFGTTRYEDRSRGARRLVYLFFATVLAHVAIAAMLLQAAHAQIHERRDLERRVAASSLSHALVFVATPIGVERAMPASDLTRNGIDFNALGALRAGSRAREPRAPRFYPDRLCYLYRFDPDTPHGIAHAVRLALASRSSRPSRPQRMITSWFHSKIGRARGANARIQGVVVSTFQS